MALLVAQLLFVERDRQTVRLDVVVVGRAETPSSPRVGEPLCFAFRLPGDPWSQDTVERVLRCWADRMAIVDVDLKRRSGRTAVRLGVAEASMLLEPVS